MPADLSRLPQILSGRPAARLMARALGPDRRMVLAGGAGLVLALLVPRGPARAQAGGAPPLPPPVPAAFLRIGADDTVTLLSKHLEMGQGVYTGLATLVAEELDADWAQMRAEAAPADDKLYANFAIGGQGTGGSTAIANSYMQMRRVGAAARAMLVAAAAGAWGVPAAEITVTRGRIAHAGLGREAGFGAFAEAAAALEVPKDPGLKDARSFGLIGTDRPRLDTRAKTDGSALFTMDVQRDGMLTVVVARPPSFGARLSGYDATAALKLPGVTRVEEIPSGVAVYASGTWAALQGRAALQVEWDETAAETRSSERLFAAFSRAAAEGGRTVEESGDPKVFERAATVIEAEYRFPYLAHAPMEPLDVVIEARKGHAEMWFASQFPTFDRPVAAQILGIPVENLRLNVLLAGGSFGRRAQGTAHLAAEAAEVAKAAGSEGSFKILWTREDDLRGGYYRPLTVHRLRAALDAEGEIIGWQNSVANQSIMAGTPLEGFMQDGLDPTAYEGAAGLPYRLGARRLGWAAMQSPVPVLWWRSVGHSHATFAVECFLDELLAAAGKDPVAGRLALLAPEETRARAVIEKVAEISGWTGPTTPGAAGRARGFAWARSFGTCVAQVVEVENVGGRPKLHRAWCAVDCGRVINPNLVRAQMEGSIGFALGTALHSELRLEEGGRVAQGNFDDYPLLRMDEMPAIEVALIDSAEAPSGVGEPGVPPLAPALANAWRVLTGAPVRQLPLLREGRG